MQKSPESAANKTETEKFSRKTSPSVSLKVN